MVNLNKVQRELISSLSGERERYDAAIEQIDGQYAAAKELAKRPIRDAVAKAESAGVPTRQIHLGLGFNQVGQLSAFLRPPKGKTGTYGSLIGTGTEAADLVASAQQAAHVPVTVKFEEGAEDEYIEFSGGPEKQSYVAFTDHPDMDYVRIDADWTKKLPNRDEIREAVGAALSEKYGKPVFWHD